MRRFNTMSSEDRDRIEEEAAEAFDMAFEAVHARMIREYYEEGGTGDWKPEYADLLREVTRYFDQREQAAALGRALGDER